MSLTDNQVKILIKGQDLKKKVESRTSQTVYELFKEVQDELVADNVPEKIVAAELASQTTVKWS